MNRYPSREVTAPWLPICDWVEIVTCSRADRKFVSGVGAFQAHHFSKFFFIVKERNIGSIGVPWYADRDTLWGTKVDWCAPVWILGWPCRWTSIRWKQANFRTINSAALGLYDSKPQSQVLVRLLRFFKQENQIQGKQVTWCHFIISWNGTLVDQMCCWVQDIIPAVN